MFSRALFNLSLCLCLSAPAYGQDADEPAESQAAVEVRGERVGPDIDEDRSVVRTTKKNLEERQPRSTPDALNFAPGVYVQQTAHAQGSPYIRGRTGQQTLLLFDGLRLNHALFRKGPNQYLFTVDARTLSAIEVVRGSASVELGNDAIAGAIFLRPLEPALDPTRTGTVIRPKLMTRLGSADGEYGGRLQLDAQFGGRFGVIAGVGGRKVGQLEAGGYAFGERRAAEQACVDVLSVPCFEDNGRTQRGTGFDEVTADARTVYTFDKARVTTAAYLYRQFDAPRTDQCPAPEAAIGECLVYEEQFRTHAYVKLEHEPDTALLRSYQTAVSLQRQHQRYRLTRPDRNPNDSIDTTTINGGRDAVDGLSTYFRAETGPVSLAKDLTLKVRYGVDGGHETIESRKWLLFAEPPTTIIISRGQYIDSSTYAQGGAYLAPGLEWRDLRLRAGARAGWVKAVSPGDEESATRAFTQTHAPVVFNAGLRWGDRLALVINVEQGIRPPNLDDLTARQSTGQGYQLDNPDLVPERALTLEAGLRAEYRVVSGEVLVFKQLLSDAIERKLLSLDDCRLSEGFVDQACRANRAPLQLVNLPGEATIHGLESRLSVMPLASLKLTGTVSYTFGEGPNPSGEPGPLVPLSRIPPLNGSGELTWRDRSSGAYIGFATRWATKQDRLSVGDVSDARIPKGGTPGYVVHDLRAGLRVARSFQASFVLENIADENYRTHGSGVLGAGRSVVFNLELLPTELSW